MRKIQKDPKHLTVMLAVSFTALILWFAVLCLISFDMTALLIIGGSVTLIISILCYTFSESMNSYITSDNELLIYGAPNSFFSGAIRLADVDKVVVNRRFFTSLVTLHYYGHKVGICPEDLNGFLKELNTLTPQAKVLME